jgi:hypothetical protein
VFPLGQRHLRGIDEPERVFEVAIDELERVETDAGAPPEPVPAPPDPPAPSPAEVGEDISRRMEDFGARLSAGIQESVGRMLDAKLGTRTDASAVDDIAGRFESLGDEIDARIRTALAKKGLEP